MTLLIPRAILAPVSKICFYSVSQPRQRGMTIVEPDGVKASAISGDLACFVRARHGIRCQSPNSGNRVTDALIWLTAGISKSVQCQPDTAHQRANEKYVGGPALAEESTSDEATDKSAEELCARKYAQ